MSAAAGERTIGLPGATGIGVAAIVGGGILALAGVAFAVTGPSAILAFGLNGVIALVTVLSFAELSTRFPQSGGPYTFAKKVLSIEAAFIVGWVVWFASIVASALYAFGFGAFALVAAGEIWRASGGSPPEWLHGRGTVAALATIATVVLALSLLRRRGGAATWLNVGKLAAFSVLIAAGLWALAGSPAATVTGQLRPFFASGGLGLVAAMGYTFIAMQGFDLIAAMGGEIRDPRRTIPRAMLYSLGIALVIYLPLLLIVATVGMAPGESVRETAAAAPEAIVAIAARNYLGGFGYWLVLTAGILSMLTALQANLLAASRVALAMARDRTLPSWLDAISSRRGTPWTSILVTALLVVAVLAAVHDLAGVGAAASLVFLLTFALVHRLAVIARQRAAPDSAAFRVPGFPVVPWLGAVVCIALAVFEGFTVPSAGLIAGIWLAIGGLLYASIFSRRARSVDAYKQGLDGELVRLRGRSPLVLVPLANPENAEAMVGVAGMLAPPLVGRVLLLNIVRTPNPGAEDETESLANAQAVLREAMSASFARSMRPEVLVTTTTTSPWPEIIRVAKTHGCESLLLGFSRLNEPDVEDHLESLMGRVGSEIVVLRAPPGWRLRDVRRVLVPTAGRSRHDILRARLLGGMHRLGAREITLLRLLPTTATERECDQARLAVRRIARDEVPHGGNVVVARSDRIVDAIAEHAQDCELIVLGTPRTGRRGASFGDTVRALAEHVECAIVVISRRE